MLQEVANASSNSPKSSAEPVSEGRLIKPSGRIVPAKFVVGMVNLGRFREGLSPITEPYTIDFTDIYLGYRNPVFGICSRLLTPVEAVEDATEETFKKAYESANRDQNLTQALEVGPWIYRIAINTAYDQLRRKKLRTYVPFDPTNAKHQPSTERVREQPLNVVLVHEEITQVQAALAKLAPKYRTALVLFHYYEQTPEEVGQFLGITKSAVKSLLLRAREALKIEYLNESRDDSHQAIKTGNMLDRIADLLDQGLDDEQLAQTLGIKLSTVVGYRNRINRLRSASE